MKLFKKISLAVLILFATIQAQNVSLNDTVLVVYGALNYNGQTIFVTDRGFQVSNENSYYGNQYSNQGRTNEQFSRYYKMIYGEDAENPNFVIDGENMGFIPFVNINELYGNNAKLINGVTVSDFAKAFTDANYPKREQVITRIKNYAETIQKTNSKK